MVLDAVVERFIEHSPISVMARLGLQRALDAAWIDELFEQEREARSPLFGDRAKPGAD